MFAIAIVTESDEGGFLRHVITYNINTWTFALLLTRLRFQVSYAVLLALAVIGLAVLWLRRRDETLPCGAEGADTRSSTRSSPCGCCSA